MTTEQIALAVLAAAVLLYLAWKQVQGAGKRARKARKALAVRVEKLELALSKIPVSAADADDLVKLESQVNAFMSQLGELRRTLITREAAEKIVTQVNAVTLDVVALKDWQAGLEQAEVLGEALSQNAGQEKKT